MVQKRSGREENKEKKRRKTASHLFTALSIFIAPSRRGEIRCIRKRVSAIPKLAINAQSPSPLLCCIQKIQILFSFPAHQYVCGNSRRAARCLCMLP